MALDISNHFSYSGLFYRIVTGLEMRTMMVLCVQTTISIQLHSLGFCIVKNKSILFLMNGRTGEIFYMVLL